MARPVQRRDHQDLPNYLGWRRALEAWGDQITPQNWIKSAIGRINKYRYKRAESYSHYQYVITM